MMDFCSSWKRGGPFEEEMPIDHAFEIDNQTTFQVSQSRVETLPTSSDANKSLSIGFL